MNKPFLKWAGNKYRVLPHLLPLIGSPRRFVEPFSGSVSVSLNVKAESYVINDINKDLINLYREVINPNDDSFIQYCEELFQPENNVKEEYIELRRYFNQSTDIKERARMFVYLNRHCFNGLSRYNSKGEFNVPFGKYSAPKCPSQEMMNFRMYFLLRNCSFTSLSFEDSSLYHGLEAGDVVYFDPPYIPASETSNFTSYATDGFTHDQQIQLRDLCESLANCGVKVLLSNHDVPLARELYKNAKIHSIQVSRTISAKSDSRKKVSELIAEWPV